MRTLVVGPMSGTGSSLRFPAHLIQPMKLMSARVKFTSDATVGTRILTCRVCSPEGVALAETYCGPVVASTIAECCLSVSKGEYKASTISATTTMFDCAVPMCGIYPGCYVELVDRQAVSAGDVWEEGVLSMCLD